jgi:tRNA pseudouridine38-40 synthase
MCGSINRYKAVVAYDGTCFFGFQIQVVERTVQGVLETALARVVKKTVPIFYAGRTDTGVHATGQVIAFDLLWQHSEEQLCRALNANLPSDVFVRSIELTRPDFHPRFGALLREYQYTILNQQDPDVLRRQYTTHIDRLLDVELMKQASACFIGCFDFASFGRPPIGNNTVRTITRAIWDIDGGLLVFTIEANAFLYRMVRNIVGTLIQVGLGKLTVGDVECIIASKSRAVCPPPAPPNGLCLTNVMY